MGGVQAVKGHAHEAEQKRVADEHEARKAAQQQVGNPKETPT